MGKRIRQRFRVLLCMIFLASILPCQSIAVSTSATAAVLMDADSGRVLYASNETDRMRIASTTKLMTALVAIENGCLSETTTVSGAAASVEGSSMYLKAGEKLTLETLLYGLLLCSGNDAAVAIAEAVSGSVGEFVAEMNRRAGELGMSSSSFANPNGLDAEGHYSTALDMAKLARQAIQNETLLRIASTRQANVGGRSMTNHNKLLSYRADCIGLKTGYTKAAGRTLVSCAERNGQRLIAVTLQDGNDWVDHKALFDYGFAEYPAQTAVSRGEILTRVPSDEGQIPLAASEGFAYPVAAGETLQVKLEAPNALTECELGQRVGEAVILLNGTEVGRVGLLCGREALPGLQTPIELFHALETYGRG